MATKLELTPQERAARRAEQSRLCRQRKADAGTSAGSPTEAKPKKKPEPSTTLSDIAGMLAAAGADLSRFKPTGVVSKLPAGIDVDDESAILQFHNVENIDENDLRKQYKAWAEDKDWRKHLRLSVIVLAEPGDKLPSVQFYAVSDHAE